VTRAVASIGVRARNLLNILADAMFVASFGWTGHTPAAFASKTIIANASPCFFVTHTLVAAFGIIMGLVGPVSSIGPS